MTDPASPPDPRAALRTEWIRATLRDPTAEAVRASMDAGFRSYWRVATADGSRIVMDSPPDLEDVRPWLKVHALLDGGGVRVPRVLAEDAAQGFLLLEDLGTETYLHAIHPGNADAFFEDATTQLLRLQVIVPPDGMPAYDEALLARELRLFDEWFCGRHLGMALDCGDLETLDAAYRLLVDSALAQPQVLVHRDWHSRNLMVTPERNPGVLDFQDAVIGPITYDLVSLLRDAYVIWDEDIQLDYAVRFWEKARKAGLPVADDFGDYWRQFEWMGLQRHLKVLGIFARLALRDGKRQYLDDIPRVWTYAHRVASRYQGLGPLARLLEQAEAAHGGTQTQVGYTF